MVFDAWVSDTDGVGPTDHHHTTNTGDGDSGIGEAAGYGRIARRDIWVVAVMDT